MAGKKNVKPMFRLAKPAVEFRLSSIAGRGVIAKRAFAPGEIVVPYAPAQRRLAIDHPDAVAAAASKITLLADGKTVVIPDTRTPGGWLCNHSCHPNATLATALARPQGCAVRHHLLTHTPNKSISLAVQLDSPLRR